MSLATFFFFIISNAFKVVRCSHFVIAMPHPHFRLVHIYSAANHQVAQCHVKNRKMKEIQIFFRNYFSVGEAQVKQLTRTTCSIDQSSQGGNII